MYLHETKLINSLVSTVESLPLIMFTEIDYRGINRNHKYPMVVSVELANFLVRRALVDQGSSSGVIYRRAFDHLKLPTSVIEPYTSTLVGFSRPSARRTGYFDLYITF